MTAWAIASRRGAHDRAERLGREELDRLGGARQPARPDDRAAAPRGDAAAPGRPGRRDPSCARRRSRVWEELGERPAVAHAQTTLADIARRPATTTAPPDLRAGPGALAAVGDRRCTASTFKNLAVIASAPGSTTAASPCSATPSGCAKRARRPRRAGRVLHRARRRPGAARPARGGGGPARCRRGAAPDLRDHRIGGGGPRRRTGRGTAPRRRRTAWPARTAPVARGRPRVSNSGWSRRADAARHAGTASPARRATRARNARTAPWKAAGSSANGKCPAPGIWT